MSPTQDDYEQILQRLQAYDARGGALAKVPGVRDKIKDLRHLASSLRALAQEMNSSFDHRDVIRDLPTVAKKLEHAVEAYQKIFDSTLDEMADLPRGDLTTAREMVDRIDTAYKSLQAIYSLSDSSALDALRRNPKDPRIVQDWALDAARAFHVSKDILDSIPWSVPLVDDMVKGYLDAPEAYVKAYLQHHNSYVERLDRSAGLGTEAESLKIGDETWMEGPLSEFVQVEMTRGLELPRLMKKEIEEEDALTEGSPKDVLDELTRLLELWTSRGELSLDSFEIREIRNRAAQSMGLEDEELVRLREGLSDFDFSTVGNASHSGADPDGDSAVDTSPAPDEVADDPFTFGVDEEADGVDMSPAPDEILEDLSTFGVDEEAGVADMSPASDEILEDLSTSGVDEDGDGSPDMSPAPDEILDDLLLEGADGEDGLVDSASDGSANEGHHLDADEPPVGSGVGSAASTPEPAPEEIDAPEPPPVP